MGFPAFLPKIPALRDFGLGRNDNGEYLCGRDKNR
jgi:hypothetical protein